MTSTSEIRVSAINLAARMVLLEDGTAMSMTCLHEADGTDTDDPALAAFATVQTPDGRWFPVVFSEFETRMTS